MEINNNARKSSASEIQNIPNHHSGWHPNHALFRRTQVGNVFFRSEAGAAGAAEEAEAESEMEEERYEDWRLWIIRGVGPGTDGTDRPDRTSGNCTIIGDSDIGEPEVGACNSVDADEIASRERDGGERDSTEIGWRGIKVRVLRFARTAKFKHDPAWSSRWCVRRWQ